MQLTQTLPADFLVIPSLAKFARQLAAPLENRAAPAAARGLCFADIADASLRATAKNGLHVRCKADAGIHGVDLCSV